MAYAQSGAVTYEYIYVADNEKNEYKYEFPNEYFGLAVLDLSKNEDRPHYEIWGAKLKGATKDSQSYAETWTRYNSNGNIDVKQTTNGYLNPPSGSSQYYTVTIASGIIGDKRFSDFKIQSDLPIFSSVEDLNHYLETGDDSKKEVDTSTDFTIYIDGESNPLYKIKWDCKDVPSSNFSTIKFYVGELDNVVGLIIGKDDFKINYDKRTYKTNYND